MFVRIKTTPNSPRHSVQLVEGVRDGGKVRQRIVRHIGVAMSPEVIRSALVHRQCSVLRCGQSGNRYVIPSKPTPAAEQIYATMGLPLTITPYQLV